MNYPHIATRLFNAPLMARADIAQQFAAAFERLAGEARMPAVEGRVSSIDKPARSAYAVADGIGVLTIEGPLVQRAGQMTPDCSPLTSYQSINAQLSAMAEDDEVKAILLEFDSPGGEVANVFELGTRFGAVQRDSGKPVWAIANEGAFSAGYALAAGAERILMPSTAMAGSIGVIMLHVDASRAVDKKGLTVTPIFAGARKTDFSSLAPLSKEALAIGQARIDQLYDVFTSYVAEQRDIKVGDVRGTEAGIFNATDAKRLGLVDEIATFDESLSMLRDHVRSSKRYTPRTTGASTTKGNTMRSNEHDAPANTAANSEQLTAARAEGVTQATADVTPKATAAGASAERARIKMIQMSDEAKTRPTLAQHLAFETEMTGEQAIAMLGKAAAEAPAPKTNAFNAAMTQLGNPRVGADSGAGGEPDTEEAVAARIMAAGKRTALSVAK